MVLTTPIADYMAANKLVNNPDKTHLMVMAPRRLAEKRKDVAIHAGNFIVTPTESERLLGITVHQSMAWNQHIRDGEGSVLKQITS